MQKLKSSGVGNYLQANKITFTDVYKYLAADGTLKNYSNMALLFKISLLIPPSTSNVERGFSVMNLLCTPLKSFSIYIFLFKYIFYQINCPLTDIFYLKLSLANFNY